MHDPSSPIPGPTLTEFGTALVHDLTGYSNQPYHQRYSVADLLVLVVDTVGNVLDMNGGTEVVTRCPFTHRDGPEKLCLQRRTPRDDLPRNWYCRRTLVVIREHGAEPATVAEACPSAGAAAAFGHTHL